MKGCSRCTLNSPSSAYPFLLTVGPQRIFLSVCEFLFSSNKPSGGVHLLADVQRLLLGSSRPAQTPLGQKQVEDPREDQTPGLRPAPKRRLDRKHEEGWVSTQALDELALKDI